MLHHLHGDVRLAWRGLLRDKWFSTAATLTLVLGIAGTAVMFSLIRGVLLRPLPVRDEARLIVAWKELRSSGLTHQPFGDVEIEAVAQASRLLDAVAGVDANGAGREVVTEDGESGFVHTASVKGPFFQVLGVDAILGRPLTEDDDVEGAERVVVISHGLWTRRYGRSRDVIGRRLTLGERRFTIVGVMPPAAVPACPSAATSTPNSGVCSRSRPNWTPGRISLVLKSNRPRSSTRKTPDRLRC